MASITLDLANYQDDEGGFDAQVVHELTEGLAVTFDEPASLKPADGEVLCEIFIEFTGPYMDLVRLIDRYEEDADLRPGLITEIKNIHE